MTTLTSNILSLQSQFLKLRLSCPIQIRTKIYLNRPKLRNPTWFLKKERKIHENYVTPDNKKFIKDVVIDKFGPPSIINGIATYNFPLKQEPLTPTQWSPNLRRTGVIARKLGNYPMWLKDGTKIHTTLLQIADNHVVKYIPPENYKETRKQAYPIRGVPKGCLLVGAESVDPSLYTREYCGLFEKSGIMPKKILVRFFISPEAALLPGTPLTALHFKVGEFVDVRAKTIDRGFQGVVKRWGFKGGPASHGTTKTHRRPGNIGGGGEKGRVWPGTKMPGHMGNRWRINKGLKIWRINTKYNVLWVNGLGIPGETNSYCYIYDTILPLRKPKTPPNFPTFFNDTCEVVPEDMYDEEIHQFEEPTITFSNK